jgi:hypothetical protein
MTRNPKYWMGKNDENTKAANPTITDQALNIMPFPEPWRAL